MDSKSEAAPASIPEIAIHEGELRPATDGPSSGDTGSRDSSRASSRSSSKAGTPERQTLPPSPGRGSPKHVKGTRAKFIRQNPRFINTPICQVLPCEGGKSVAECLEWKEETGGRRQRRQRQMSPNPPSPDSTLHRDFRPPSPDTRPRPLQRFSPTKASSQLPFSVERGEVGRERISFHHQYDCRTNPSEPERGKLHGSFVWAPTHKTTSHHHHHHSTATASPPSLPSPPP